MRALASLTLSLAVLAGCAATDPEPEPVSTSQVTAALQQISGSPRMPCPRSSSTCVDMYFVAHEDDDVLFMNPDIMNSINQGNHVVVVYLTAGDVDSSDQYWVDRERGVLNAYAYMTRGAAHAFSSYIPPQMSPTDPYVPDSWQLVTNNGAPASFSVGCTGCGPAADPNNLKITQYSLINDPSHQVSLVFLRLGDFQLENLWPDATGTTATASFRTCSGSACPLSSQQPNGQSITKSQLVRVLHELITYFGANSVSAQDSTNLYSDSPGGPNDCNAEGVPGDSCGTQDNPSHIYAAYFALAAAFEARAELGHSLWLRLYRDYTASQEPANLSSDESTAKTLVFNRQGVFDAAVMCATPERTGCHAFDVTNPDNANTYGPYTKSAPRTWEYRQYDTRTLVGTSNLRGRLRVNGNCLGASGTLLTSVSCSGAPSWVLTTDNQIQLYGSSQCITIAPGSPGYPDAATLASCSLGGPGSVLFMFGNGQIRTVNSRCLTSAGDARDCDRQVLASGHAAGIPVATQDWTLIFDDSQTVSTQFDHTVLSGSSSYYQTFRIVNQNVCAREAGGVYCASSNGNTTTPTLLTQTLLSSAYPDSTGWSAAQYGNTVAGVWQGSTSSMIACGRGVSGLTCGASLSSSDYSDANGWASSESYYNSLRYIDLYGNGLISACGHAAGGVACSLNLGTSWGSAGIWSADFSNANGWSAVGSGDTLQFADVDGDGRTDVCGRGPSGIMCGEMAKTSPFSSFINIHYWSFDENRSNAASAPDFSNSDPGTSWLTSAAYYGSIRLVDLNRDGFADVCGRTANGIECAFSTGSSFERARLVDPLDFTDALGWNTVAYGSTLSFGDLDGDARIDVCGAGYYGVVCAEGY